MRVCMGWDEDQMREAIFEYTKKRYGDLFVDAEDIEFVTDEKGPTVFLTVDIKLPFEYAKKVVCE
jgi:hypothetical protein